jgi:hypothetical protein
MELKEIRRLQLGLWFKNRAFPEREKSYISQLISGKASFGEKAARRLERDYGMPDKYLDQDTTNRAEEPVASYRTNSEQQLLEDWRLLLEEDQERITAEITKLAAIAKTYRARFGAVTADNDKVTAALSIAPRTKEPQ